MGRIQCLREKGRELMIYDGVVIGGGPAGIFAAIVAARQGSKVLLIEKNDRLGKKLLITGKGRCNITNSCTKDEFFRNVPRNGKFLYSAIDAFPPQAIIDFFEEHGCPVKVERGNRVFPVSDRSASVLDCLKNEIRRAGVTLKTGKVSDILVNDGAAKGVVVDGKRIEASWVILATGGVSYPATGSTGDGYVIAKKCGHTIVQPEGSLVPLVSDSDCAEMQGLSLRNVDVKLLNGKGKVLYRDFGELLFTHFGVSGPTVLSASAHLDRTECKLAIDLKPAMDEQKLDARILRDLDQYCNRSMENALVDLLPRSMIPVVLKRLTIPSDLQANSLKKEQRKALVSLLKGFEVPIVGKRPVAEAIVTSGGIKVGEINPKTMESKLLSGLYFAGEIIDCDAYTGGFNLQIAWSTAYAAGMSVKNFD